MGQTTNGLANDGNTRRYAISYDSGLSDANGRLVAHGLMDVCEQDLDVVTGWFGGTDFAFSFPISVEINSGDSGGSWTDPPDIGAALGFHPTVRVNAVGPPPEAGLDVVRYLLVSEVTEMYMASKDNGWYEHTTLLTNGDEGSKGEGLSRFLAHQFTLARGITTRFPRTEVVPLWLTSPTRPNYVDGAPDDTQPDVVSGGTTCFLYYLHDQLGHAIPDIIDAGSTTLAGVYRTLTGRTDAWPSFIDLVTQHYPPGTSLNTTGDNIFPVPNLTWVDTAVRVVAGASAQVFITLDRTTPVDVTVQLTSDDPGALAVPPAVLIPAGALDAVFLVQSQLVIGVPRSITIHATYAGVTVSAPVWVLPAPSMLTGVISDGDAGGPIDGAVVVIDGSTATTLAPAHLQLRTGPDGSFTAPAIPPDTYTLEVTASGYVPGGRTVVVTEGVTTTRADVALLVSHPFTVRGTVTDPVHAPLPGVAVTLIENGLDSRRTATTTDGGGAYSVTMDPGFYTGDYTLVATLPGYAGSESTVPSIPNGATVTGDVVLVELGSMTGLVMDGSVTPPVPVAGAWVAAGTVTAESDATGRYALQVPAGPTAVTVAADGFERAKVTSTVPPGGAVNEDFALVEASATLTGTVSDGATGDALHDAFVRVDGARGVHSGFDGEYTVSRIPAGPARLTVTAPGYRPDNSTVEFTAHGTVARTIFLATVHPNPHPPS